MPDPTQIEQLFGLLKALVSVYLLGGLTTAMFYSSFFYRPGGPVHDPDGLVPGAIEWGRRDVPQTEGGLLPDLVGIAVGFASGLAAYLLGSTGFLLWIGAESYLLGSAPTSYPTLYYIGALAIIIGHYGHDRTERELRLVTATGHY